MPEHTIQLTLEILLLIVLTGIFAMLYLFFIHTKNTINNYLKFKENELLYQRDRYDYQNPYYYREMPILRRNIEQLIEDLEFQNKLRLSPAAKTILILPLIEFYQNYPGNTNNDGVWRESIYIIMRTVSEISERRSAGFLLIDATDINKAINAKWCNIPPFCKP